MRHSQFGSATDVARHFTPARRTRASGAGQITRPTPFGEDRTVNKSQTQVLQWGRRVRGFLGETEIKSDVAELTTLTQELDDALGQLTTDAAAQEAIAKQSRVQTTEIEQLRQTLRD